MTHKNMTSNFLLNYDVSGMTKNNVGSVKNDNDLVELYNGQKRRFNDNVTIGAAKLLVSLPTTTLLASMTGSAGFTILTAAVNLVATYLNFDEIKKSKNLIDIMQNEKIWLKDKNARDQVISAQAEKIQEQATEQRRRKLLQKMQDSPIDPLSKYIAVAGVDVLKNNG